MRRHKEHTRPETAVPLCAAKGTVKTLAAASGGTACKSDRRGDGAIADEQPAPVRLAGAYDALLPGSSPDGRSGTSQRTSGTGGLGRRMTFVSRDGAHGDLDAIGRHCFLPCAWLCTRGLSVSTIRSSGETTGWS